MNADNTFTQTPVTAAADKARSGNLLVVENRRGGLDKYIVFRDYLLLLNLVKSNSQSTYVPPKNLLQPSPERIVIRWATH